MKKRILSLLLALVMVLGMFPMSAMAAEGDAVGQSALTSLEIAVGSKTIDEATVQTLTPAFVGTTTEYSTEKLDYIGSSSKNYVWIKAEAAEGAAITAQSGQSGVTTIPAGEWTYLEYSYYYWGQQYSGTLSDGAYNKVSITVTDEDGGVKEYTVTIPVEVDLNKSKLEWKTDLSSAIYYTKDSDSPIALSVEAKYTNRPLEDETEITYQWYSNTTASTEGGTAINGATGTAYTPGVASLGKSYYYAVATCGDKSITSKVIEATVTDEEAPQSVSIVCDHPYTIPDTWASALGGVKFVAKVGDTLRLKAVDENGEETPVVWLNSDMYGGTLDKETGIYTITSTSYSYVQVASLYDAAIQSEEKAIQVVDYAISQYNKTPSVTLSSDGQSFPKISTAGGLDTYTIWSYTLSENTVAKLDTDLSKKGTWLNFLAMRPGTIEATMNLDLNGDGQPDGAPLTDTATLTINGVAIEDASGQLTKTYLEMGVANPAPTMQLKALSSTENPAFTWSSADETVATVDENGLVTAQGVGSVIISASDGTYTGGIKVVVTSADIPYFEQIDFVTGNVNQTELSNATWKTANFKAATLEYTGMKMTKAAAGNITLNGKTVYNTAKYTAVAEYTDAYGNAASIPVHSGDKTILNDLPFDTNVIKITLSDKTDKEKKTVYTFEITRPRDTDKSVAQSGIAMNAVGRELVNTLHNGKVEGFVFRADAEGVWNNTTYVVIGSHYNYRTWAQNGLEAFNLTVKSNSDFSHARYSIDDGESWTYLGQPTKSGKVTGEIRFPVRGGVDENPVVKVQIQFLDDKTYAANIAAGKDGFADSTPNTYSVWVEQLPAFDEACDILTAETDSGDWYPAFDKDITGYRIMVANGAAAPTLTFTVSEGAAVKVDGLEATPTDGKYSLTLGSNNTINIKSSTGNVEKNYTFGYSQKSEKPVPDKVVDYLSINSQYTNGNGGGYGVSPQQILGDTGLLSLGNFGGYVTAYYEEGLTDNPNNPYGIDFYIDGNAFEDVSTGTGLGSMEPGQVWVSEDGSTWYALAGSEHYEDSTIWDYAVTYTKTATGGIDWSDNQGNTMASTHGRAFGWPRADMYALNDLPKQNSFTLTGILLPCVDGTITGKDTFNSFSKGGRFGYVDVLINGRENPYLENEDYTNESTGFDLAWAVDSDGNIVDVSEKSFHYVKVVTASNLMAGSANEKSTEVGGIYRAEAGDAAVGKTAMPAGVTVSGNGEDVEISFASGQNTYSADLGSMKYVSIKVNGVAADDNIYVNNQRVSAGEAAEGIKVVGEKLVRIIVQNGEKEPVICLLKLNSAADDSDEVMEGIKIGVFGVDRVAETKDGQTYKATVGHRIDEIQIKPIVDSNCELWVNGAAMAESYALQEGENTFTVKAVHGGAEQTATLIVTREQVPVSNRNITVSFKLLGDDLHGDADEQTGVHTLRDNNLKVWIPKRTYTVPDTYTVLDLITIALEDADIGFVNEGGNYISQINGIGEFDNGNLSGWMYTLNGKHPGWGVAEQTLSNGDDVILHYTDDYTVEEGSEGYEPMIPSTEEKDDVDPETGFTDVAESDFFYDAVKWAVEKGITNGTSDTTFSPNASCTRAQMVTFLWRAAGCPKVKTAICGFSDVDKNAYYYEALLWAVENGITNGTSDTTFSPDADCNRGQMATFLYRSAKTPVVSGNHSFTDVKADAYYNDAVIWAAARDITKGTSDTTFSPDADCTRGQMVTFLYRYLAK